MSHVVGTVLTQSPALAIGPDSGASPSSSGVWTRNFAHAPAPPPGTRFLILHFRNASLPANNRLEVDLGYGTDVFTSADGSAFWTRPVHVQALSGGLVPIRYVTDGASSGGVELDRYGRGERHAGDQDPTALSNCDPFLTSATYTEPKYDPFWFCHTPPDWENVACVASATDVRRRVARSVGMIVTIHGDEVSTCSVTLVDSDLVLTAGHCLGDPAQEWPTSSVTFDYQTTCSGGRPAGYQARFHKVRKLVKWRNTYVAGSYHDYALLQLEVPAGGLGIPPVPMRHSLPAVGEQVFGIHHPNGAVKKVADKHPGFATVTSSGTGGVRTDIDVSGGSSGSGLFDTAGRIVGVLSNGHKCSLSYFPTATVQKDVVTTPSPPTAREVMLVFDRSGSMSMSAGTGRTKIEEARDAASLFVELVRAGGGNEVGLVSFSTSASSPPEHPLAAVTAAAKTALIGPPPYSGGKVGGLAPGGLTTIGGGLEAARLQFPAPGANPRTILLLTDGMQNTPPMVASVEPSLGGIGVNAIGFGTEASLDGALLTRLAQDHEGMYTRAGSGLDLKKFFALAFGDIFEAGALLDPELSLPAAADVAAPLPFLVCGEERVTVVVGWDRIEAPLRARVRTPGGTVVESGSPGVESSTGRTWTFLRIPLPFDGERDGEWQVEVTRARRGGEFPTRGVDVRYFVNVLADGGPRLRPLPPGRRFYTGDTINPRVILEYPDGTFPHDAEVDLVVSRPDDGPGNLLARAGLRAPETRDGDEIPARQATLLALEAAAGAPVVGYGEATFPLFDDARHDDGALEPDGVFGNPLAELLTVEGSYTFRARATYGEACTATRETRWSLHVDVGVDPGRTDVTTVVTGTRPDGRRDVELTLVPRDRHGNHLGPGRLDGFEVSGGAGTTVTGPPRDEGDGSYVVPGVWDPDAAGSPGLVVGQPGRPPVLIVEPRPPSADECAKWKALFWLAVIVALALLALLIVILLLWLGS